MTQAIDSGYDLEKISHYVLTEVGYVLCQSRRFHGLGFFGFMFEQDCTVVMLALLHNNFRIHSINL